MEPIIQILIYLHVALGGTGLMAGGFSLVFKKGGALHRRSGVVFSWSMGSSALLSMLVARMPGHQNDFLFGIGIFTLYMVLAGNRALSFKGGRKTKADWKDWLVSSVMAAVSFWMILQGFFNFTEKGGNHLLSLVFGGIGMALSLVDFKRYQTLGRDAKGWLTMHLSRMVGALIASVTAFIVTGIGLDTILFWIAPSIVGSAYIAYWILRVRRGSDKRAIR